MDLVAAYDQLQVVEALQRVAADLSLAGPGRLQRWLGRPRRQVKGLYLWGGVGRGKTWLMDLFFDSIPGPHKVRLHFHRFMQQVHAELGRLRQRNPLQAVARRMARDYRREVLGRERVYHWPADAAADAALLNEFQRVAGGPALADGSLEVNGRSLPYRYRAEGVVWFDFEALCGPPRSQVDYIELARTQHTVFLSDVPVMGASRDDRTRRFIFLIDEFYDRRVKLVISTGASPSRLYMGERLAFEFQRTASRLTEMQTETYLHSPHRG